MSPWILCEGESRRTWAMWILDGHNSYSNLKYLSNKTNTINQTMRSTTAILMWLITYKPSEHNQQITQKEKTPGKHLLKLEDISLISTRNNNNSNQNVDVSWLQSNTNRTVVCGFCTFVYVFAGILINMCYFREFAQKAFLALFTRRGWFITFDGIALVDLVG